MNRTFGKAHWVQVFVCLAIMAVSVWVRLRGLPAMNALQDSVGPYWAAVRLDGRAHAEPYGFLQVVPYIASVRLTTNLWDAFQVMAFIHASVSVVAALLCFRICPGRWALPLIAGTLVALDPGLIDTALSGSKCYLAAVFVGLIPLVRGGWVWPCWAFAVANHPLALVTLPLVVHREAFSRNALPGLGLAIVAVGWQAAGWTSPGVGDGWNPDVVGSALNAFAGQGGLTGWLILMGPLVGLSSKRTRALSLAVLVSLGMMFIAGVQIGYLRDHHIRMLTVPALVCWAALPGMWISILVLCLRVPPHPVFPADLLDREGTLGLAHRMGDVLAAEEGPLVVDGAWFSGAPAIEPSAAMLDLWLRGWTSDDITPDGDVVVVVSCERDDLPGIPSAGRILLRGDRYRIFRADQTAVRAWSAEACKKEPRLGGAWDAMSVLHPNTSSASLTAWWACD